MESYLTTPAGEPKRRCSADANRIGKSKIESFTSESKRNRIAPIKIGIGWIEIEMFPIDRNRNLNRIEIVCIEIEIDSFEAMQAINNMQ